MNYSRSDGFSLRAFIWALCLSVALVSSVFFIHHRHIEQVFLTDARYQADTFASRYTSGLSMELDDTGRQEALWILTEGTQIVFSTGNIPYNRLSEQRFFSTVFEARSPIEGGQCIYAFTPKHYNPTFILLSYLLVAILSALLLSYFYCRRSVTIKDDLSAQNILSCQSKKNLQTDPAVFQKILDIMQESTMIIDSNFHIIYVNHAFENTTKYSYQQIEGKPLSTLYSSKHDNSFYNTIISTLNDHGTWSGELWMRRADRSVFPEWLSLSSLYDKNGQLICYIGVFADLTQSKRQDDALEFLSNFDPLTSLPNKNLFLTHLSKKIAVKSEEKKEFSLVIIAINELDKINESYDHIIGDYSLKVIAQRLKSLTQDNKNLARISSREFAVIVEDGSLLESLQKTIEDFQLAIVDPISIDGHGIVLSSSVGYALYPRDGQDLGTLMKSAQAASIFAHHAGMNVAQQYSGDIGKKNSDKKRLEYSLRESLEKGELSVYYQPKVCLVTDKVLGAEALVRWMHPDLGFVSPGIFIPLAEEVGLIDQLGQWVLQEACAQNVKWIEMGHKSLVVSVNLSAGQFQTGDFTQIAAQCLWNLGLPAENLELELTESLVMQEPEKCKLMLRVLQKMGVKVSIDDFGTGYSSLSHLRSFPVDTLKIDRAFVKDILTDQDSVSIIKAIITMAKSIHLSVIAEGVESKEQACLLKELGCDAIQGFYIAKALPADEFTALLKKYSPSD